MTKGVWQNKNIHAFLGFAIPHWKKNKQRTKRLVKIDVPKNGNLLGNVLDMVEVRETKW